MTAAGVTDMGMAMSINTGRMRGITTRTMLHRAWIYREVVRHHAYYAPAPVYYAPRPAAGIHVVLPNIYIPIR